MTFEDGDYLWFPHCTDKEVEDLRASLESVLVTTSDDRENFV